MAKSKKVLDRDMMFRKIMPALADNPFSAPVTEEELLRTAAPTEPAAEVPPAPEPAPEPQDPRPVQADEAPRAAEPAETAPAPEAVPEPGPIPARRASLADAPFTTAPVSPEETDNLSVLRAKLFARSDAALAGLEQVSTVNLMESLVLRHLDAVMQRFNCCRCDRCRRDIAACALNLLPPQYVVADSDHLDALSGTIPDKDIYNALVKAVLKVRAHPRH